MGDISEQNGPLEYERPHSYDRVRCQELEAHIKELALHPADDANETRTPCERCGEGEMFYEGFTIVF